MTKTNIAVKEIDEDIWLRFTAHAKVSKLAVGELLEEVLNTYLEKVKAEGKRG